MSVRYCLKEVILLSQISIIHRAMEFSTVLRFYLLCSLRNLTVCLVLVSRDRKSVSKINIKSDEMSQRNVWDIEV